MVNIGRKSVRPRVVLAKRAARKMAVGASLYLDEETAEALVGLIIDGEEESPVFYVLDTIAPAHDAIERANYMVEQGDDLQDEIMYWYAINWRRFRELRRKSYGSALAGKWDAPLRYLGDWHKQPGEMFWPSAGDLETARAIIEDVENDMPQIIAPIVTMAPPWDDETGPAGDEFDLYVTQEDGPSVRINFWYLNRELNEFIAAKPDVMENDMLPALPPLSWHLTDRQRFQNEFDLLSADGLAVSITEWDADEQPPMEICFMVGRMGGSHVVIIITDKDYPEVAPEVRIAPMLKLDNEDDLFERLWQESRSLQPGELQGWQWDPETGNLLDLVKAVEAALQHE